MEMLLAFAVLLAYVVIRGTVHLAVFVANLRRVHS